MMQKTWLNSLSFAQKQRLQFIEAMLIWDGSVQRADVCKVFDVTPNHLTRDIKRYRTSHKNALEYDPETRAYRQGHKFKPLLASGSASEYLVLLQAYSASQSASVLPAMGHITQAESLAQPAGSIDAGVLKLIMHALQQKTGVALTYQSLGEPDPVPRTLWPHTLVFTGERWHVRAYDGRRQEFRDFVLTRCSGAKALGEAASVQATEDVQWNSMERVEVVPAARLSSSQQVVIAREFGMKKSTPNDGFTWTGEIRKCLVGYFLYRHRLERGGSPGAKVAQGQNPYLQLKNQELADVYRFSGD